MSRTIAARTRHRPGLLLCAIVAAAWPAAAIAQGGGPQPSPVHVDPVTEQEVQQRRLVTGDIMAVHRSDVAAREPGLVTELLVQEGQAVRKGDVLVRLDKDKLSIELEEVESRLAVAEAQVAERTAEADWAEHDLKLIKESFAKGAANPREVLNAESDASAANARLTQAQQQVKVTRSSAALLRTRLADMEIVAPYDGFVVDISAEPGEWLSEGDAVVEMISSGPVEAWMNVPQENLRDVRGASASATIGINASGAMFEAPFDRIIPQVNPNARRFVLIARIENSDGLLAPGMSVTGWLPISEKTRRLTVSKDAVLRNDAGAFVYVVREGAGDGPAKAAAERVEVLYPIGGRYVIESSRLRDGDRVVIEGNERLFPQAPIQPIEREPQPDIDLGEAGNTP